MFLLLLHQNSYCLLRKLLPDTLAAAGLATNSPSGNTEDAIIQDVSAPVTNHTDLHASAIPSNDNPSRSGPSGRKLPAN